MLTIQKYLLISSILFGHLINTMNSNFNDFSNDYIKLVILYLHDQPCELNKSPDEQITLKEPSDQQINPLKYFYSNILHFASINKRINRIINNLFSEDISYQNLVRLHKEKELTLFYCPCKKNEKLCYVEVKLHFEEIGWKKYPLENARNYGLILKLYTYDISARHDQLMHEIRKIWVNKRLDSYYDHSDYLEYCMKYIKSEKIQENSIDTIKTIIENITTLSNIFTENNTKQISAYFSFDFQNNSNLYILPRICCQFFEPFTWDVFCNLITLKYDARVNNVT